MKDSTRWLELATSIQEAVREVNVDGHFTGFPLHPPSRGVKPHPALVLSEGYIENVRTCLAQDSLQLVRLLSQGCVKDYDLLPLPVLESIRDGIFAILVEVVLGLRLAAEVEERKVRSISKERRKYRELHS